MWSLVGLSVHSAFHWFATRTLFLSDELMSCCVAGTHWCLDLRRRLFVLDGWVSTEWSRCPGSMVGRARDSEAPL